MKFTIEIACDNDAFGPDDIDLCQEVRRCLSVVRNQVTPLVGTGVHSPIRIMDVNGNAVGWAKFSDE